MKRVIVTVVGKDRTGIIASVCTYLAKNEINILNITQSIVDGFFNMMMIVDIDSSKVLFEKIQDDLTSVGDELGVKILAQKEEIFDKMHRI